MPRPTPPSYGYNVTSREDAAPAEREVTMLVAKLNSTCLAEATYDTGCRDMTITFAHGGRYRYRNVPEAVYRGLVTAPSAGRAFHATVRGRYPATRI